MEPTHASQRDGQGIVEAVLAGMAILVVATVPRNVVFAANFRYWSSVPWSLPLLASYLWLVWRYLGGWGSPGSTADARRSRLRARSLTAPVWAWALLAGTLGLVTLVLLLRIVNRLIELPAQQPPDISGMPVVTLLSLLVMSSLFAGVVEEASFRGYMQGPIERAHGPVVAILVTGVMFAVAHLDFTPVLLPYYVAVAAIYGMVTYLTQSILPAVVLHTAGNTYSNADLWWRGRTEWQSASGLDPLFWNDGAVSLWVTIAVAAAFTGATMWAYFRLAVTVKNAPGT